MITMSVRLGAWFQCSGSHEDHKYDHHGSSHSGDEQNSRSDLSESPAWLQ